MQTATLERTQTHTDTIPIGPFMAWTLDGTHEEVEIIGWRPASRLYVTAEGDLIGEHNITTEMHEWIEDRLELAYAGV